jgi:putative exporter of polyketide antibiotics
VSFASVLDAGLNVVPPAVCILGIGTFVLGVWPRASTVATYCVVVWSFLVELMGGVVGLNHWVLDASLFHQMAAAPAVSPDWTTGGVLVAIGAVAAVLGGTAFAHRDLKGE